MAFLRRLSHDLFSIISPNKPTTPEHQWCRTSSHRGSHTFPTSTAGTKRKRDYESDAESARRALTRLKLDHDDYSSEEEDGDRDEASSDEDDQLEHESDTEHVGLRSKALQPPSIHQWIASSQLQSHGANEGDDLHDESTLLDERLYPLTTAEDSPSHKNLFNGSAAPRIITGPESLGQAHLSAEALAADGWDNDYITLLHRIVLRGYEPLLPSSMNFPLRFLPDELFSSENDPRPPFITSSPEGAFHAEKHFSRLMDLPGRVRDLLDAAQHGASPRAPEQLIKRELARYNDFLLRDAGLDPRASIPVVAIVAGGTGVSASILRERARQKCARAEAQWRDAIRLHQQELDPEELDDGSLRVPTLYALIVSHLIVALWAYKPRSLDMSSTDDFDDKYNQGDRSECTGMALFDLSNRHNDVWDALALACVGCHARNVAVRMHRALDIVDTIERAPAKTLTEDE